MIKIAVLLAFLGVTLSACGNHLDHGIIVGKQYSAPYTYIEMVCASFNKYGSCVVSVPVPINVGPNWTLNLQDGDKSGSTDVDEKTFDSVHLGQRYP